LAREILRDAFLAASVEAITNSHPDERSMRECMLAGDLYLADDPQLAAESDRA